jgi:hypothetical protein
MIRPLTLYHLFYSLLQIICTISIICLKDYKRADYIIKPTTNCSLFLHQYDNPLGNTPCNQPLTTVQNFNCLLVLGKNIIYGYGPPFCSLSHSTEVRFYTCKYWLFQRIQFYTQFMHAQHGNNQASCCKQHKKTRHSYSCVKFSTTRVY